MVALRGLLFGGVGEVIDYEKLKIAHELAEKYKSKNRAILFSIAYGEIGIGERRLETFSITTYEHNKGDVYFSTNDIDGLIAKLTELTQTKPKYKVGQRVWFLENSNERLMECIEIEKIRKRYNGSYEYIQNSGEWVLEEQECYASSEELIDAQIDYWTRVRDE